MYSPSSRLHYPLPVFSVKSSPPTSSSSSMKIKNLIHTLIVSHLCRILRALSKVKAAIVESTLIRNNNKHYSSKKIIMGSFRLHYNWCSSKRSNSHVLPVPSRVYQGLPAPDHDDHHGDEDNHHCHHDSELAGYLQWLEDGGGGGGGGEIEKEKKEILITSNEIDVLAEMFIENSHEKFKLEKQESDRRFQEMLARSL